MYLTDQYVQDPVPLYAIYYIRIYNRSNVELEPLADSVRLLNIISNTAWRVLAEGAGKATLIFQ